METHTTLAMVNILCGMLFIAVSTPMLHGKIKMNTLYGFRLSKAFESEQHWFCINEYGAKQLIIWSIPVIIIGLLCLFIPITPHSALSALLGFGPVTVFSFIAIVRTIRYAHKL